MSLIVSTPSLGNEKKIKMHMYMYTIEITNPYHRK